MNSEFETAQPLLLFVSAVTHASVHDIAVGTSYSSIRKHVLESKWLFCLAMPCNLKNDHKN